MAAPNQQDVLDRIGRMEDELRLLRLRVIPDFAAIFLNEDGSPDSTERIAYVMRDTPSVVRGELAGLMTSNAGSTKYSMRTRVASNVETGNSNPPATYAETLVDTGGQTSQQPVTASMRAQSASASISASLVLTARQGFGGQSALKVDGSSSCTNEVSCFSGASSGTTVITGTGAGGGIAKVEVIGYSTGAQGVIRLTAGSITRLLLNQAGESDFATGGQLATSFNPISMNDRTDDPSPPSQGGKLYCKGGGLYYIGSGETVTQLAPA